MSESDEIERPKKLALLAAYAECGNVTQACKDADVARSTHYEWLKEEAYKAAFEEAHAEACDNLERHARRRATKGWLEPVFGKNGLVGKKRRYSDTLLIFLLKGNNPAKFGDRVEQTHKGDAASPLVLFELPINGREAIQDE